MLPPRDKNPFNLSHLLPAFRSLSRFDKWSSFLLVGLCFTGLQLVLFVAVYVYMPNRLVTIPYRGTVLGLSILVILFALNRKKLPRINWVWGCILWFAALYALRIFADGYLLNRFLYDAPSTLLLIFIGGSIIPMFALARGASPLIYRYALWGYLSVAITASLMSAYLYRGFFAGGGGRLMRDQFYGDFVGLNPLTLAYMGVAVMLVGLALFTSNLTARTLFTWWRVLPVLFMGLGLVPFVMGSSRGALVALIVGAASLIFARLRREQIGSFFMIVIFCSVGSVIFYFVALEAGSSIFDRFTATATQIEDQASGAVRLQIWTMSMHDFLRSPIWGYGLTPSGYGGHPHNALVESFLATGILGGIPFTLIFCYVFKRAFQIIKYFPEFSWIGVFHIQASVGMFFSSSLALNTSFWCGMGLVIGLSANLGMERAGWKHRLLASSGPPGIQPAHRPFPYPARRGVPARL